MGSAPSLPTAPLTLDPKAHFPPGSLPHTLSPTGGPARLRKVGWSINHYFCRQEPSTPLPVGPSGGVSRGGVALRPGESHLSLCLSHHVSRGARPTLLFRPYRRPPCRVLDPQLHHPRQQQGCQLRPTQTGGPRGCAWRFLTLVPPSHPSCSPCPWLPPTVSLRCQPHGADWLRPIASGERWWACSCMGTAPSRGLCDTGWGHPRRFLCRPWSCQVRAQLGPGHDRHHRAVTQATGRPH